MGRGEVYTGFWWGSLTFRRKWEDNTKMGLKEVRWGNGWIDLALVKGRWRALVNAAMKLRVS